MESDWKKFRVMAPLLRERYIREKNARILAKLSEHGKTDTERFWDALEYMEREANILHECLDGHSRSKMGLHLMLMRGAGMLRKEDLADFSEELQKQVFQDLCE